MAENWKFSTILGEILSLSLSHTLCLLHAHNLTAKRLKLDHKLTDITTSASQLVAHLQAQCPQNNDITEK
jgi:hypothetical protein